MPEPPDPPPATAGPAPASGPAPADGSAPAGGVARVVSADLGEVAARFGARLRRAGLPVGPDRCERFARAAALVGLASTDRLRWCARATLASDPAQVMTLDAVFDEVFGVAAPTGASAPFAAPANHPTDPADHRGDPANDPADPGRRRVAPEILVRNGRGRDGSAPGSLEWGVRASAGERLGGRDFAGLSAGELRELIVAMRRIVLATPPRPARRNRPVAHGRRVDLRATLRRAHRTGGDPVRLVRHRPRTRPRRLVALCDISGSMAPYARAMLHLLYCATRADRAEVFTFATRLTRLTPVLTRATPAAALERAGRAAPDWSGGTRIAATLREFIDGPGRRGLARGAVVLIISDGWETGDPAELGRQMARLSRLAFRIVWVNPRTRSERYRPLVGGMAAAWPHCDAVVSAHTLAAVGDLIDALADPVRRRTLPSREER